MVFKDIPSFPAEAPDDLVNSKALREADSEQSVLQIVPAPSWSGSARAFRATGVSKITLQAQFTSIMRLPTFLDICPENGPHSGLYGSVVYRPRADQSDHAILPPFLRPQHPPGGVLQRRCSPSIVWVILITLHMVYFIRTSAWRGLLESLLVE